MSFKDIFTNAFLDNGISSNMDTKTIAIRLLVATLIGLYIFVIYKTMTRKTFYEKTFNISLIAMSMITAAIILTIQSNIVLSLGMVGALSIVRFRTAVKEPLDLAFLYWSISAGIICGAGLISIAGILSLLLTAVLFAIQKYPGKKLSMVLVVNCNSGTDDAAIINIVKKNSRYYKIKSKSVTKNSLDLIVEVRIDNDSAVLSELMGVEGVVSANLLSHDGEINA
ncbi:MAG: DUF4956 domain-containing protein [Clostridia bacterium]|nr:DUF4956 domain-containing protein [Clostridia bacterium]